MSFWDVLHIGESALNAQQMRLDIISNNIANAETTRTAAGGPYQRQDVVFSAQESNSFLHDFTKASSALNTGASSGLGGVQVDKIVTDNTPGARVYDPAHPDADKDGYVTYPNVNMVVEMTNMLSASRSYEAGLAVVDTAKKMATKALDIGK
jgi:flagellar basal-body rod protein FlgC